MHSIPAAGFMVAVIMMGFAHGGSQLDPQPHLSASVEVVLVGYWRLLPAVMVLPLSMIIAVISLFSILFQVQNTF